MNIEEQRRKMLEAAEEAMQVESLGVPSTFIQAKQLANDELEEIINELEKFIKKFERSEVFKTFGRKYLETILSSKEQFAKVLNTEISQEEFEKLSQEKKIQVTRQQVKRRELLHDVAKSYNLL